MTLMNRPTPTQLQVVRHASTAAEYLFIHVLMTERNLQEVMPLC